jgi:hypothetical protein
VKTEHRVGISILEPLCGVDDDLEANLEQFATLDWRGTKLRVTAGTRLVPLMPARVITLPSREVETAPAREELLAG